MRNRYRQQNQDPRWITAKHRGICIRCHGDIKPGEQAFYFPRGMYAMYCDMPDCGKMESARFEASAMDEGFMNSSMNGGF